MLVQARRLGLLEPCFPERDGVAGSSLLDVSTLGGRHFVALID